MQVRRKGGLFWLSNAARFSSLDPPLPNSPLPTDVAYLRMHTNDEGCHVSLFQTSAACQSAAENVRNVEVQRKVPLKAGPVAASAQARKSKFGHNMSHEWSGKVLKFHGAIANGVWYQSEKLQVGADSVPATSNRVNAIERLCEEHCYKQF